MKKTISTEDLIEIEEKEVRTRVVFLRDGERKYRYLLKKQWDKDHKNNAAIIMLNPSKADSLKIDLTVMNVMNYLVGNGFSGMTVVNLFSYMSTDPEELKYRRQDYEKINIKYLEQAFEDASIIIIGWTRGENILEKRKVKNLLSKYSHKLKCFKDNNGKTMRHPSRGFNEEWTLVDYNFMIEGL